MPIGTIKRWDSARGYGFISDDTQPAKRWSFVHISALNGIAPEEGDAFEYELQAGRAVRAVLLASVAMVPSVEPVPRRNLSLASPRLNNNRKSQ